MKLRDICRRAGIKCPKALFELEITGITSNSKRVDVGNLFFCLSGTKNDGHRFIDEALKLLFDKKLVKKTSYIVCESDRFDILGVENSQKYDIIKTMKHGVAHVSVLKPIF